MAEEFPTYIEVRRKAGGIFKGLYNLIKDLSDRVEDVEAGTVAEGSIGTDELADEAVTPDKIADMDAEADIFIADDDKRPVSVTLSGDATLEADGTLTIGPDKVDSSKIPIFVSTEQTGNGSAQSIAHGLGVEPATVMILLSSVGTDGATYTYTKGSTNVNVTATTGAKYFVVAIA
jgi:hypothetical protein